MAKKKVAEEQNINDVQMAQQEEAMALQNQLQEINAINEHNAIIEQQAINKSHDEQLNQNGQVLNKVTEDDVKKAYQKLLDYKNEKASLENKIAENEDFWKMNHWDVIYKGDQKAFDNRVKPKSAWLFNLIINKHADAMDNYPEANILPRARDDEHTAEILSDVIPVVMEQNNYEDVYSDAQWYKCKNGTSVQGIFWNNEKSNGLGDIEIKNIDLLSIFWKGGITNIQDSPNVFVVDMVENEQIKDMYPGIDVGGEYSNLNKLDAYHVGADTTEQSAVIDWYYKKKVNTTDEYGIPQIKTVLHYCKFCNDQIIYASENDPRYADRGWYDHGMYPFVFDTLFPIEGSITGIGFIDIEKDDQIYIDKMQQAILESAIVNARPRYFFRNDGQVNEEEFLDLSKPIIHIDGSIGDDNVVPVMNSQFNAVYESVLLNKISELKDTSGNTASSQGQTSSVTSASGIASLQEAAGKLSRDANTTSYRAYRKVVYFVIELIRQFYDAPRCFRIAGQDGKNEFLTFDNSGLMPQEQGSVMGANGELIDLGSRLPIMDIVVKPQKRSAYSKDAQNQTALNLYSMGFFAPTNADASLSALDMMEFDEIDKVRDTVRQNGTLMQMVMQLQQELMAYQQVMAQMGMVDPQRMNEQMAMEQDAMNRQASSGNGGNASGGSGGQSKGSLSTQAASVTRGSATPR